MQIPASAAELVLLYVHRVQSKRSEKLPSLFQAVQPTAYFILSIAEQCVLPAESNSIEKDCPIHFQILSIFLFANLQ